MVWDSAVVLAKFLEHAADTGLLPVLRARVRRGGGRLRGRRRGRVQGAQPVPPGVTGPPRPAMLRSLNQVGEQRFTASMNYSYLVLLL